MPIPNKVLNIRESLKEEFIGQLNNQATRDMFCERVNELCREHFMPAGHGFKWSSTIDMETGEITGVCHIFKTREQMQNVERFRHEKE